MNCAAKGCHEPACSLVATQYPTGAAWRFCLHHFWPACHALLNRGAERLIISYPSGAKPEKAVMAPWLGPQDPTP